jgi:voltage-gated potassium channel Kch
MAATIYMSHLPYRVPENLSTVVSIRPLGFWESIYFTSVTFSTLGYGDITPATRLAKALAVVTCCGGAIFLGLVAASAFKRMER